MNLLQKIKHRYNCRKAKYLAYARGRVNNYEEGDYIISFRIKKTGDREFILYYGEGKIKNLDTDCEEGLDALDFTGFIDLAQNVNLQLWDKKVKEEENK